MINRATSELYSIRIQ